MPFKNLFLSALALVSVLGFSPQARAEIEKYIIDKPHTQIIFAASHLGLTTSYGKFLDYEGHIIFDRGEPAKSSVEVTIKAASLDLGDEKWNAHMKNADFFDVEKYPTVTFKSTGIQVTGENTANITGDLTMRGVTRPVTLAVTHNKSGKFPMNERMETGFSATTMLKRSEFGMTYGLPMVPDEVKIILEVEAYREDPAAGGTANP
jgi:polyisoprenoid-binding protein YceI